MTPHLRAELLALLLLVHRLLDLLRVSDKVLDDLLSVSLAVIGVPTFIDVELVSVYLGLLGASRRPGGHSLYCVDVVDDFSFLFVQPLISQRNLGFGRLLVELLLLILVLQELLEIL